MYVANHSNNQVHLTDSDTGQVVRSFFADPGTYQVEGNEIAIRQQNGQTVVYDIPSGQQLRTLF